MNSTTNATQAALREVDAHIDGMDVIEELTDARYHHTHELFEGASNQRALILDWLGNWADNASWPDDRPTDVLTVGCGGGVMDHRIARVFADHAAGLKLAGVDPNPRHTRAFLDIFDDADVEATATTSGFEDYETDQRFDVIHFIHCLYYFEELAPALERALHRLRPGGTLIIMQAPNDDLNNLADRLWQKQWDRQAWYSDDIRAWLEKNGHAYHLDRLDARVDITRCLDPEDKEGTAILDFIAQTDTRELSPDFRSSLRESLDAIAIRDGDRLYAEHPVDAITVTAGPST